MRRADPGGTAVSAAPSALRAMYNPGEPPHNEADRNQPSWPVDLAWAVTLGCCCLALYLATLQPDFGGPEDTPKFQFLGYVLGTAHPPGYPLYVWLSHLFVQLPLGSIAYRANLFSAVMAAVSCALAFLLGRQAGASRRASLCAALALAAGASFWRSAVFAEVYSLAAVVAALTIAFLLAWDARPGAGRLLGATAAFALGLGNHLTIIGLIPACLLFVFVRHRRALNPRVVAGAFAILVLGVSQYGLIILRTVQGAPYLESRATTVRELVGVVTAERFAGQRFAFGPWVLLTDHLPAVTGVMGRELGIAGVLLLAAGLVPAARRRNCGAALLLGSAAGMLGMVLNLSGDLNGFITPVMVLVWPLTALGVDALSRTVFAAGGSRWLAAAIAIAAASAMPAANLAANYRDADQSGQTAPGRFFRSAYRQLPNRAGVVTDNYFYDMALDYMMLTGEAGPRRGITRTGFDPAEVRAAAHGTGSPRRVFAFAAGGLFLGTDGLQFDRTEITGPPLSEWLLGLPPGTLVVGATAFVPLPLDLSGPAHSGARPPGRPRAFEAFAVRTGTRDAAWRGADEETSLQVDGGVMKSPPALAGVLVAATGPKGARIDLAGEELASVNSGLVVAAFSTAGTFLRADAFRAGDPVRVPFQEALYELTGDTPCVELTSGAWSDVSPALTTGSWIASLQGIGTVDIETEIAPSSGHVRAQSAQLLGDGGTRTVESTSGAADGQAMTTELTRSSERRPVFRFSTDRPGVHARARLRPGGIAPAVKVCAHRPPRPLFPPGASTGTLRADFESEAYYGAGWGDAVKNDAGALRHGGDSATLLLPLPGAFGYQLTLDVRSVDGAPVAVIANGQQVGACGMRDSGRCEVFVAAAALREGVSAISLVRTGPPRSRSGPAIIFRGARLERRPADGASANH